MPTAGHELTTSPRDHETQPNDTVYDAEITHLIQTLDSIIASHTAKLHAVTEALRRELENAPEHDHEYDEHDREMNDPRTTTTQSASPPQTEQKKKHDPVHTHTYADSEEMARWILGLRELMREVDVQLEAWDGWGRWSGAVVRGGEVGEEGLEWGGGEAMERRRGSLYWDALDVCVGVRGDGCA